MLIHTSCQQTPTQEKITAHTGGVEAGAGHGGMGQHRIYQIEEKQLCVASIRHTII